MHKTKPFKGAAPTPLPTRVWRLFKLIEHAQDFLHHRDAQAGSLLFQIGAASPCSFAHGCVTMCGSAPMSGRAQILPALRDAPGVSSACAGPT